jgi:hypothetical protein
MARAGGEAGQRSDNEQFDQAGQLWAIPGGKAKETCVQKLAKICRRKSSPNQEPPFISDSTVP